MRDIIQISAAAVLIVSAGLVQGAWTHRWGSSAELAALAARFDSIPLDVGDWKGTASDLSPEDRAMAGAEAWLHRKYTNPSRGVSVSVMLLGGLPGKISTHTPDVCYKGAGYTVHSAATFQRSFGPDGRPAEFRTALATREGTNPSVLRIFWSWKASTGWAAPQEPRWEFAAAPALWKLYVARETAGVLVDPEDDPCNDFLSVFLPELNSLLFMAH